MSVSDTNDNEKTIGMDKGIAVTPTPEDHTQNVDVHRAEELDMGAYHYTPEESRSIVRKCDIVILPLAWGMYLFNSLDRNAASNAKSDGMTTQLHFPNNGYSNMISVTFATFCALGVPATALTRRVGPQWTLPSYMLGWGAMAMISSAAKNYGSMLAVRAILGAFEAGFASSLIYYLTTFYQRGELGMRIAAFYSCNCLSGAFSGLLAYGVFQANSYLHGWQILFLIEGAATAAFAILTFIFLPASPSKARFLSPREKEVARLRSLRDGSQSVGTTFSAQTFFAPLKDWKFYVFSVIAVCYGTAGTLASNFLTQIIGRFGYSTVKTNLFTVAPYVTGTLVLFLTAYSSDHFRERSLHLSSAFVFVIIGCVLLAALPVTNHGVAYFATFLITMGAFTPSVLFHSWHQCNEPSEDGRAFRVGTFTFLANTGGIVSANIFRDEWAPHYVIPLIITACLEVLGLSLVLALRTWMALDNRRRNREQGVNWGSKDVPTEALGEGPSNPLFRHFV